MKVRYDAKVDAMAIDLRPKAKSAKTVRVSADVAVDFDRQGRAISVEILNASHHLGAAAVKKLPSAAETLTLAEAAKRSGREPGTLRRQIHLRKLKGEKRGRDWYVDATSLENYLESVEARAEQAERRRRSA